MWVKRILFYFLVSLVSLNLSAQQDSSNNQMSVGFSGLPLYYVSNYEGNSIEFAGLALKGSFGIFLSKKFSLENNVFYYWDEAVYYGSERSTTSVAYGLQISLRYYLILNPSFKFYADAGLGFGILDYSDDEERFNVDRYDTGILLYTAGVGALFRVYKALDFEVSIPYIYIRSPHSTYGIYGRTSTVYTGLGGPSIGIRYWF